MKFTDTFTENDNQTYCAIRIMGFVGFSLVASALLFGTGIGEVGVASAAIITAVGGSLRLKGDNR